MRVAASCGSSSRKSRRKSAVLIPDSCLLLLAEEPGKVWAMSLWGIVDMGMRATIAIKEVEVGDIIGFKGSDDEDKSDWLSNYCLQSNVTFGCCSF